MRKVNLGCGNEILKGWENYDLFPANKDVKKLDLNKLPLPFETDSVDEIRLFHILEHLTVNPYEFILECHRVIKHDGVLHIKLPVFSPRITHVRAIHDRFYFDSMTVESRWRKLLFYPKLCFETVYVKGRGSILGFFFRLKEKLLASFYVEYEYKYKIKKDVEVETYND